MIMKVKSILLILSLHFWCKFSTVNAHEGLILLTSLVLQLVTHSFTPYVGK